MTDEITGSLRSEEVTLFSSRAEKPVAVSAVKLSGHDAVKIVNVLES